LPNQGHSSSSCAIERFGSVSSVLFWSLRRVVMADLAASVLLVGAGLLVYLSL